MSQGLLLLGTIHRDPQGAARLGRALEGLAWGLVSVEVSPYALAYRRRRGAGLLASLELNLPQAAQLAGLDLAAAQAHPACAWLRAYLQVPFEWRVAREQAARRGAPCLALDFSQISRRLLADTPELVSVANLGQVLAGPPPPGAELERRRAAALLAGRGGWPRPAAPEPQREAGLARRLRRLMAVAERRGLLPLVHVGGWQHLLAGQEPPALAERLGLPPSACILV